MCLCQVVCRSHLLATLVLTMMLLAPHAAFATMEKERLVLQGYPAYQRGDYAEAERLFRIAARDHIRAAQYNLAVMLLRGETQRKDAQANAEEALLWLRQSAEAGFVDAGYALGKLYEEGHVTARDLAQAMQWYELAAKQGHAEAQLEVAVAHLLGRGRAKDAALAAQWAEKAAEGGNADAQYLIASFYENGDGVKQDLHKALNYYIQAARGGDEAAPHKAKALAARLQANQ